MTGAGQHARRWLGPALVVSLMVGLVASAMHARYTTLRAAMGYETAVRDALKAKDPTPARAAPVPPLPPPRSLAPPATDVRVGFFDLLEVQGCELGVLLGERNSPLGKVMESSERLIYELRVLAALPRCQVDEDEEELRAELEEALALKRAELPSHMTRALWGGPELRALLNSTVEEDSVAHVQAAVEALRQLARFSRAPSDPPDAIRAPLGLLHRHRAAGGVLRQAAIALHTLTQVTALVQQLASQADHGCPRGPALREAFSHHYVGAFQPQLAHLQEPLGQLAEALETLWMAGPQPDSMAPYAHAVFGTGRGSLHARLLGASRAHAAAMTEFAARCGIDLVGVSP